MSKLMLTLKISALHDQLMTGVIFILSLYKPKVQKINWEQVHVHCSKARTCDLAYKMTGSA